MYKVILKPYLKPLFLNTKLNIYLLSFFILVSVIFEKQVLPESGFGWFSQPAMLGQYGFTSDISEKPQLH